MTATSCFSIIMSHICPGPGEKKGSVSLSRSLSPCQPSTSVPNGFAAPGTAGSLHVKKAGGPPVKTRTCNLDGVRNRQANSKRSGEPLQQQQQQQRRVLSVSGSVRVLPELLRWVFPPFLHRRAPCKGFYTAHRTQKCGYSWTFGESLAVEFREKLS